MYAKVIVEIGVKSVDKMFTYSVPKEFQDQIQVGERVKVPFGHQILEGFVLQLSEQKEEYEVKNILELVDNTPILTKEMLELGEEISNITLCSKISAYQAMLPKALKASHKTNISIKLEKYISLNKPKEEVISYLETCHFEGQKNILKELLKSEEIKVTRIDSSTKTLLNKNMIKLIEREGYRYHYQLKHQNNKI